MYKFVQTRESMLLAANIMEELEANRAIMVSAAVSCNYDLTSEAVVLSSQKLDELILQIQKMTPAFQKAPRCSKMGTTITQAAT